MRKRILALVLILVITLSLALSGCEKSTVTSLSANIEPEDIWISDAPLKTENYCDFTAKLFNECFEGKENTLVSPLSVALAFAMVAEGANGETLAEIENILGMDIEDLRNFALSCLSGDEQLSTANSLWINDIDGFTVNNDFLQRNATYHDADIYKTKFSGKTVDEINNWVKDKTDGMIDSIINELDRAAVMCLVNALLFDAKWETPYSEHNVSEGEFVTEKNVAQTATYLCDSENYYLEDDNAEGFIKYYEGGKYAFAAMLPNEGVSVKDYLSSLNGEKLNNLLENPVETTVYTSIPKFEYKTDLNLKPVLMNMGIEKAFDEEKADFSSIGQVQDGNIWIGEVLHSTKISVTENGTKAGAATAVALYGAGAPQDPKEVYLDRPFVYMIVDMENKMPIFMGTLMSLE